VDLPLAEFNAFHGVGLVFAAFGFLTGILGSRRAGFPSNDGALRALVAVAALMLVGTVTAAIATSEKHSSHESSHGDRENPTHKGESPENAPNE
jgi:hypothetical protein